MTALSDLQAAKAAIAAEQADFDAAHAARRAAGVFRPGAAAAALLAKGGIDALLSGCVSAGCEEEAEAAALDRIRLSAIDAAAAALTAARARHRVSEAEAAAQAAMPSARLALAAAQAVLDEAGVEATQEQIDARSAAATAYDAFKVALGDLGKDFKGDWL